MTDQHEEAMAPVPTPPSPLVVRVLVVADVRMYREGLAAALRAQLGVQVVGALPRLPPDLVALRPDIVLYDVSPPKALENVREHLRGGGAKIVVVAMPEHETDMLAYAEAGVSGYVTCEQSVEDVVDAVMAVARGEMICTPRMAATLVRHVATLAAGISGSPPFEQPLTPREREIAGLIERGMSNKQIARMLQIQVATVKNHVHRILEKLHVQRRGEAAAHLRRHEPAPIPPGVGSMEASTEMHRPTSPALSRQSRQPI